MEYLLLCKLLLKNEIRVFWFQRRLTDGIVYVVMCWWGLRGGGWICVGSGYRVLGSACDWRLIGQGYGILIFRSAWALLLPGDICGCCLILLNFFSLKLSGNSWASSFVKFVLLNIGCSVLLVAMKTCAKAL